MTNPGWYPDPEGTSDLRWWDGQQWTSAVHGQTASAPTPPPTPEKTPQTPEQKRRNYIAAGIAGALIVAFIGYTAWQNTRDDDAETRAATTTTAAETTSAATPTSTTTAPTRRPTTTAPRPAPTTTTVLPPSQAPAQLPPATSPQEVGCDDPDPSVIAAIEGAITDGRILRDIAAVSTTVNGVEYEYVGANVFRSDGTTRSVSGVVWLSPGVGVVNLSSNSRDVTPEFVFGRGTFGNAGDDAGQQVQECVSALARGR